MDVFERNNGETPFDPDRASIFVVAVPIRSKTDFAFKRHMDIRGRFVEDLSGVPPGPPHYATAQQYSEIYHFSACQTTDPYSDATDRLTNTVVSQDTQHVYNVERGDFSSVLLGCGVWGPYVAGGMRKVIDGSRPMLEEIPAYKENALQTF